MNNTFSENAAPLEFCPVELSQTDRVENIRHSSGNTLFVYAFASLYVWKEVEGYEIYVSDDAFLVRHKARGENVYMFPCGTPQGKKRLIDALLSYGSPTFSYVCDEDRLFLEREYPGRFSFVDCRDDYPYLYDKDEQIALAGKDFKNLRHQVHLGRNVAETWSTEPLCPDNVERALDINRKWAKLFTSGDLADTAVAETALLNYSTLGLWGVIFQADGKDAAYVVGNFVTPEIFDVSFCKVLERRCDCFIKWALYCALPSEVKTVDSEEDMGLAGLRTHKLLRRPKELVRIWKGTLR